MTLTLRAPLSGTFLQTLPDLVMPLKGHSLARVSGRVVAVVVVVRELFSLVASAICVRVRGYEDCFPHDSSFSSTAAFSPQ